MYLRFLGTGAADWQQPEPSGEFRRNASMLVDGALLMDGSATILDMLPTPSGVEDMFFTHSHDDHFSAEAVRAIAPKRVYAHESWAAGVDAGGAEVIPLRVSVPVTTPSGFTILPLPANHATETPSETALHYLIERDGQRLLYATDGAWMLNRARRLIGGLRLDAAVFDATIGDIVQGDYRVFEHNSLDMVRLMTATLRSVGVLRQSAPVFLTHMARTLHPDQKTLEASLQPPFIACYDGMTAEI